MITVFYLLFAFLVSGKVQGMWVFTCFKGSEPESLHRIHFCSVWIDTQSTAVQRFGKCSKCFS